jgi:hypothetical protein
LSTSPTPNAYRIPLIRTPTCLSPNNQLTQHTRQREAPISAGIWVLFHKCVPHHTLSQSGLLYYWMDWVGRRGELALGLDGLWHKWHVRQEQGYLCFLEVCCMLLAGSGNHCTSLLEWHNRKLWKYQLLKSQERTCKIKEIQSSYF